MNLKDLQDFQVEEVPSQPAKINLADLSDFEVEESKPISQLESGARGLADTASFGFADEIAGLSGAALEWIKNNPQSFKENYQKHLQESRANIEAAKQANPGTFIGGQVVGAIAPAIATLGASAPTTASGLIGQGALQALGSSEADLTSGNPEQLMEAAVDTAKGGVLGGAIGAGGKLLSTIPVGKYVNKLGDEFKDVADNLSARAQGVTKSLKKNLGEQKVKEIGRFGLEQIDELTGKPIITPFASTDDMLQRAQNIKRTSGKKMGDVFNTIDEYRASTFDPEAIANKFESEAGDFWRSPLNKTETRNFDDMLEAIRMRGEKPISMEEAQILKSEFDKVANWGKNTQFKDLTPKEQMARQASTIIKQGIEESADVAADSPALSGTFKDVLKEAKQQYGTSSGAEKMLLEKQSQQGNRLFSLTDAVATSPSLTYGAATGDPSSLLLAGATYAGKKGLEKYGPQIGAITADKLGEVLKASPQVFGKWSGVLNQAAQRGGTALAATNYVLQQRDPEYRQQLNSIFNQDENE